MPKAILEGRTREQRVAQGKNLGSLRSLTVQPKTKKRYDLALEKFFSFLDYEKLTIPKQRSQMDDLVSDYLEHLWASGEGRALASDTVAALQNTEPHLKGQLLGSWRLLKVWSQQEIPNRAPPLPEIILHAMVGRAIMRHDTSFALSLLLSFYGMLRTGELLSLLARQVEVSTEDGPAVISLGMTKGGQRQGASESITVTVHDVVRRLRAWKATPKVKLTESAKAWRAKFAESIAALGLESFQFRPYSLRRGGATFWFSKRGSLDRLLIHGRWQTPKTARIYINNGLATLAEMKIPMKKIQGFVNIYRHSLTQPVPNLERALRSSSGGRGKRRKVSDFFRFWRLLIRDEGRSPS